MEEMMTGGQELSQEVVIALSGHAPVPAPTTVMASDVDVSNGFVKNGTSLPYIIETNKSGSRKRSSKILPECAICGKKFVCVTTMKRHLVTHTGERPFNCKICGKQYTQKGNLRVHERTHNNYRPFECNICHQRFYRKEPMQKHQWRQHGIGHYKSRPTGPDGNQVGIIGAESVLYNSLIDRISTEPENTDDTRGDKPGSSGLNIMFEAYPDVPEPATHTEIVGNFSEDEEPVTSNSISQVVTKYINDNYDEAEEDPDDPKKSLEMLKLNLQESTQAEPVTTTSTTTTTTALMSEFETNTEAEDQLEARPMKLKMKLAQAYLKEVEEEREKEERDGRCNGGRDSFESRGNSLGHIEENLGEIQLSKNSTITAVDSTININNNNISSNIINDVSATIKEREFVECVCKSCGAKCSVSDPYNFSCQHCNVKYTSLPTHMIADPLQCIGCLKVFEHKPAMKEHQTSADKERPFVCCKCGYEFKQKAHLQKHQWRIHRRKLEPDPNVKEAEAILKAVNEMSTNSEAVTTPSLGSRLTADQVNELILSSSEAIRSPGPEARIGNLDTLEISTPLDLSPCKMYGSATSINQWVQQVETARTPIIPDISILKKPIDPADIKLPTEPLHLSQLQQERVSVTIQLLDPPPVSKAWIKEPSLPTSNNQPFAIKSKPTPVPINWRAQEDNPLLNQKLVLVEDLSARPSTQMHSQVPDNIHQHQQHVHDRLIKRQRVELTPTQLHPADLSINQTKLDFSPPSPPLNLSSKNVDSEDLPFDYTITRSELIKGQLRRMRNQDERSGI